MTYSILYDSKTLQSFGTHKNYDAITLRLYIYLDKVWLSSTIQTVAFVTEYRNLAAAEMYKIMENEIAEEIQRRKLISNYWEMHDDFQVNTDKAAMLLGKKPATLKKWRSDGCGPAFTRGRPVMYRIGSLRDYIEGMQSRQITPNCVLGVASC